MKDQMYIVKDFGQKSGFEALITDKWEADETDGWEMTSITAHLLNAKGAYRTLSDMVLLIW